MPYKKQAIHGTAQFNKLIAELPEKSTLNLEITF